jgi:hypothetical protein
MALARAQYTVSDQNDPIMQGTAPANPVVDTLWLNTSITPNDLRRWTGTAWASVGKPTVIDIPQAIPSGSSVVNTRTSITDTGFRVVNSDTGEIIGGLYAINGKVFLGASALVDPRVLNDHYWNLESQYDQVKGVSSCGIVLSKAGASGETQGLKISGRIFDTETPKSSNAIISVPHGTLDVHAGPDMAIGPGDSCELSVSDTECKLQAFDYSMDTVRSAGFWTEDGTDSFVFSNCHVVPADATWNLGRTSWRWRRLYCTQSPDVSSDARFKQDIADLDGEIILKLRPRAFRLKSEPEKVRFGLIAQEVKQALDACGIVDADVYGDEDPDSLSLRYEELISPLIAAVQGQHRRIDDLEARLATLEDRLK